VSERADITRLRPAAFRRLPSPVRKALDGLGCTIPQAQGDSVPGNVISGEFARRGQRDVAVLCSDGYQSKILVYWRGRAKTVSELASTPDENFVQDVGDGVKGFSRKLHRVRAADISASAQSADGRRPKKPVHDGISDDFVGKGSSIWYWQDGEWIDIGGTD
jgi:hypothetical protein